MKDDVVPYVPLQLESQNIIIKAYFTPRDFIYFICNETQ